MIRKALLMDWVWGMGETKRQGWPRFTTSTLVNGGAFAEMVKTGGVACLWG